MYPASHSAKRIVLHSIKGRADRRMRKENILIHTSEFIEILKPKNILYLRAEGNYTMFFLTDGRELLCSKTLGSFANPLMENGFLRPHKSFMVNATVITRLRKQPQFSLVLRNGIEIPVARSRKQQILQQLTF